MQETHQGAIASFFPFPFKLGISDIAEVVENALLPHYNI